MASGGRRRGIRRRLTKRFGVFLAAVVLVVAAVLALGDRMPETVRSAADASINAIQRAVGAVPHSVPQSTPDQPAATAAVSAGGELPLLTLVNYEHRYTEVPANLVFVQDILGDAIVLSKQDMQLDQRAAAAAREMFLAARQDGILDLVLTSAYRSSDYQEGLFRKKLQADPTYGSDPYAAPVSVMPSGMSEHATGLALDVTSREHPQVEDTYADTPAGQWLLEHCKEYGFILRYPKDKEHLTGVVYEPWHYRYVGEEAAREIWEQGLCLEEYVAAR